MLWLEEYQPTLRGAGRLAIESIILLTENEKRKKFKIVSGKKLKHALILLNHPSLSGLVNCWVVLFASMDCA